MDSVKSLKFDTSTAPNPPLSINPEHTPPFRAWGRRIDFSSLWKHRPDRLGLEVDTKQIKAVRLRRVSDESFEVADFGSLDIDLDKASPADQQKVRSFLKNIGGRLSKVAVSIEDPTLRIRRMSFPKMPERDLIEAIRWNFREHVDCPLEDYNVGYTEIRGWEEGEHLAYCTYGVASYAVKKRVEMMRQIGLKAVSIEPKATALLAAFNSCTVWEPRKIVVCIFLEETNVYFIVMADGQLLFSRPMAGVNCGVLIKHIARNLSIDENSAEDVFKKCVFETNTDSSDNTGLGGEANLSSALSSYYSQLVLEIQRSIDAFCLMFKMDHVDKIYLCGAGAYCPGLASHIKKTLGIETQIFNPFAGSPNIPAEEKARSGIYAVSYGLAIP